jgi:hypothetical protein
MHTISTQDLDRGRTWLHAVNMTHTFCHPQVKEQLDAHATQVEIVRDVDTNENVLLHMARFAGTSTFDTQQCLSYMSCLYALVCNQSQ